MLKALATEKNVQDVVLLYREHFDNPQNTAEDVPILQRHQPHKNPYSTPVDGADTGAEHEAKMTRIQLGSSLGFLTRRPLLFNVCRHKAGLTTWMSPDAFALTGEEKELPSHLESLRLHWHQLSGVHAIIRMIFTPEPERDHCTGVLVADEVGLGKTYQSATVIAFLADTYNRQRGGYAPPPLLGR